MNCPFAKKDPDAQDISKPKRFLKEKNVELYLMRVKGFPYDKNFLPKKPDIYQEWWEKDSKTKGHAKFCLPLLMANGLGYDILSPATFEIYWNGNENHDAELNIIDKSSHAVVDTHSAHGSFTVQTNFLPKTEESCFTFIKGIPNIRRPFSVMEGLVETWWNPANFGLVCLCNSAGKFIVRKGDPIARMIFISDEYIKTGLTIKDNDLEIEHRIDYIKKRSKHGGLVLDYFKGLFPNGKKTNYHLKPSDYK